MEPAEVPSQISKDNFLEVPNLSDSLGEDEEVKATFRPGYSPQPSRRSSGSSEDMYLDTPTSASRRVSFADSLGFSLVSIKEFDCWELPSVSTEFDFKKDVFHTEEYVLSPLFEVPSSKEELLRQLQVQKATLEATECLPGSTSMKGIIRVLNMSFEKLVYVRMSLDDWQTHYDILAEYVPNSCDGETDQFSFKISLVPPYQKEGSRVEFCIRYETSVGTFWSNNNGTNYILVCQKKKKEPDPVKPLEEASSRQIKGCLKVKSSNKEESSVTSRENNFENTTITDTYIPTIICSHEDGEDMGASHQDRKDSDLMINQHVINRSTASSDEKNTFSTDQVNFANKAQGSEKMKNLGEQCTDLLKRPLSSSSSPESSLQGDVYHSNKYSSGLEGSHQPSEEITSDVREARRSLGDTRYDESVLLHTTSQEVLDDNANPTHGSGRAQMPGPSLDQLMAGDLDGNPEEGTKKLGTEGWEYFRKDFCSDASSYMEESSVSSKDDYDKWKAEKDQRACVDVQEKPSQSLQFMLQDQERKMGHPDISMEETEGHDQDFPGPPSRGSTGPARAITTHPLPSTGTKANWREGESTTSGQMPSQVGSPQNVNLLRDDSLFQVERNNSDHTNPKDEKNTQHSKNWNILESPGKERGSERNPVEQIKEQADCKDLRTKRGNRESSKAPPTEQLFTCQETAGYELSLTDGGIAEKAQAVAAYIIKTTLESTPASMSARGNAIIAQLPPETARSDRPIEVKETAFDAHEGRNDESHYTLCQRAKAGVIHDNDFEKESRLDICNIHVGEMKKEEAMSMYHPGKRRDRAMRGFGNTPLAEESSQAITGSQKATPKVDLSLGELSTDRSISTENRAQSIPSKFDHNCSPTNEIQGYHAVSKPKDVSKSSDILMPGSRKQRHMGQIFQGGECSMENSLGPMIVINEPLDNVDEVRHGNEGSFSSGQPPCSSGDKGSERSALAGLTAQESQAQSSTSVLSKYINSKIPYFLLFLIFLVTIYYYDLMIGLAFYLFSLYWLYWEGGRQKESVKKK